MIVHFKDDLDGYHQRRADQHGYIFKVLRTFGGYATPLLEARSIATGVVCTLESSYTEEVTHGQEAA